MPRPEPLPRDAAGPSAYHPHGHSPTAIVQDGAEIGPDTEIGPYCVIHGSVRIGAHCRLHSHIVVDGRTEIGDHCEIYPFAVLGTQPQDKKIPPDYAGKLRVGEHNQVRECVTIHGGPSSGAGSPRSATTTCCSPAATSATTPWSAATRSFTNGAMAAGHTEIQDHAILGALVGVHQFGRVGTHAMIGAGAMLSHDAPPFALVQGDRARLVGVNKVGLRRGGFSADEITTIKRVYRLLFWRRGVLSKRLAEHAGFAGDDPHAHRIMDFVAASDRGICATRGRAARGDVDEAEEP